MAAGAHVTGAYAVQHFLDIFPIEWGGRAVEIRQTGKSFPSGDGANFEVRTYARVRDHGRVVRQSIELRLRFGRRAPQPIRFQR